MYKVKQSELTLTLKLGKLEEKTKYLIEKLLAYDPDSKTMIVNEARDLVQRSGMLLVPRWDLRTTFFLYQIIRKEKFVLYEAFGAQGLQRGSTFNIDTNTLAMWSMAPKTNKPKLMDVQDTTQGNIILWTLGSAIVKEIKCFEAFLFHELIQG